MKIQNFQGDVTDILAVTNHWYTSPVGCALITAEHSATPLYQLCQRIYMNVSRYIGQFTRVFVFGSSYILLYNQTVSWIKVSNVHLFSSEVSFAAQPFSSKMHTKRVRNRNAINLCICYSRYIGLITPKIIMFSTMCSIIKNDIF